MVCPQENYNPTSPNPVLRRRRRRRRRRRWGFYPARDLPRAKIPLDTWVDPPTLHPVRSSTKMYKNNELRTTTIELK